MGMLFHDIGKGWADNHPKRGAGMWSAVGARLGLHEDETAATEFLIREHLTMSHLAQHRDIHDDRLVIDFCRACGCVENLERLYVLTYADMRGVGPGVWNQWRGMLVTELYVRAREFFERGEFVPEDRGARAPPPARPRARPSTASSTRCPTAISCRRRRRRSPSTRRCWSACSHSMA